jgi:hypothetical protein
MIYYSMLFLQTPHCTGRKHDFNQEFWRSLDRNKRPVFLPQAFHDLPQSFQKSKDLYSSEHQLWFSDCLKTCDVERPQWKDEPRRWTFKWMKSAFQGLVANKASQLRCYCNAASRTRESEGCVDGSIFTGSLLLNLLPQESSLLPPYSEAEKISSMKCLNLDRSSNS